MNFCPNSPKLKAKICQIWTRICWHVNRETVDQNPYCLEYRDGMQIIVQILVMVRLWKKPRRAPKASAGFNPEIVFKLQNFADQFGEHHAR